MVDILIGTTDYTRTVFIPDPASTDGSGKTGLTAADLTVSYTRVETDNDVVVTDVTSSLSTLSALTDAHTDWGIKEVSSTLAPGLYRIDIADAVFAAGAWSAVVYVMITSSAAAASPIGFELVGATPDTLNTKIDTIDDFLDTEIAAIKAKTDNLPSDPADASDIASSFSTVNSTLTTVASYIDTEVSAIKTQTDKLTFDGANHIVADARKISTSSTAADNIEAGALGIVPSTCASGSSTTAIVTNLTEATDDHYNGRVIVFTGGALAGQASDITDYNGTTKTLTVTALTEAPANTDPFVIV